MRAERFAHLVELEWLDDGDDEFHALTPVATGPIPGRSSCSKRRARSRIRRNSRRDLRACAVGTTALARILGQLPNFRQQSASRGPAGGRRPRAASALWWTAALLTRPIRARCTIRSSGATGRRAGEAVARRQQLPAARELAQRAAVLRPHWLKSPISTVGQAVLAAVGNGAGSPRIWWRRRRPERSRCMPSTRSALALDHQVGADRAARLERRQRRPARRARSSMSRAHQQGVAVPAEAARPPRDRRRAPRRCRRAAPRGSTLSRSPKRRSASCSAITSACELAQHRDDPLGIAPPVEPHRLVDVVAGESELHAGCNAA